MRISIWLTQISNLAGLKTVLCPWVGAALFANKFPWEKKTQTENRGKKNKCIIIGKKLRGLFGAVRRDYIPNWGVSKLLWNQIKVTRRGSPREESIRGRDLSGFHDTDNILRDKGSMITSSALWKQISIRQKSPAFTLAIKEDKEQIIYFFSFCTQMWIKKSRLANSERQYKFFSLSLNSGMRQICLK